MESSKIKFYISMRSIYYVIESAQAKSLPNTFGQASRPPSLPLEQQHPNWLQYLLASSSPSFAASSTVFSTCVCVYVVELEWPLKFSVWNFVRVVEMKTELRTHQGCSLGIFYILQKFSSTSTTCSTSVAMDQLDGLSAVWKLNSPAFVQQTSM